MLILENLTTDFQSILNYLPDKELVLTLYLAVNPATNSKHDYTTRLNSMLVEKKAEIEKNTNYDRNQKKSILGLMDKIKTYIGQQYRASYGKTLLVYAGENNLWKEVELPQALRSRLIIDPKPHTQTLRAILSNTIKYGVLIIDREKSAIDLIYLGKIQEQMRSLLSEVPSKVKIFWQEKTLENRVTEKLHQYYKQVSDSALNLFQSGKFNKLILAGKKEILSGFKEYMHSFLQQIYIGDILAEPETIPSEISARAVSFIKEYETKMKNDLIDRLIKEFNPYHRGVLGVRAVIDKLMLEQIKTIIYDINFSVEGYVCKKCHFLTLDKSESCPYCGGSIIYHSDITDEIIETALNQSCEVMDVENNLRLVEAGSIGAILRYEL